MLVVGVVSSSSSSSPPTPPVHGPLDGETVRGGPGKGGVGAKHLSDFMPLHRATTSRGHTSKPTYFFRVHLDVGLQARERGDAPLVEQPRVRREFIHRRRRDAADDDAVRERAGLA